MTARSAVTRVARMTMSQLYAMSPMVPIYPDTAAALGYSRPGMYRAAKDGTLPIPVVTLPHTRGRFCRRADILAFLGINDDGAGIALPAPPVEPSPTSTGSRQ